MSDNERKEEPEKTINLIEYDELGNRFVYNPLTGFHEYSPEEKDLPYLFLTDFAK
jgi:hypothetical protein